MLKNIKNSRRLFFVVGPANTGNHLLHLLFENAEYNNRKCFGKYIGPQQKGFQLLTFFAYPESLVNKEFNRAKDYIKGKDIKNIKLRDIIGDFDSDIIYRLSVPAGKLYSPLLEIAKRFENEGYQVIWIIPIRDFYCAIKSKKNAKRCKNIDDGWKNLQREYKYIFDAIIKHGGNFWLIPTSIIFTYPEIIVKEMKNFYGLKVDTNNLNQIFDADRKWRNRIIIKK